MIGALQKKFLKKFAMIATLLKKDIENGCSTAKKGFENVASFYVSCILPNNFCSPGLRCLCGDYDLLITVANQIVEKDNE